MPSKESWYARAARDWTCAAPDAAAAKFHRQLPGYASTPLVEAPDLAAGLGVGRLFVKDESARFDLRAFKFLGASWAGFRAVARRSGYAGPAGLDGLRAFLATAGSGLALVTATDGNHGRAVARPALVSVPAGVGSLAQAAIAHYRRPDLPRAARPRLLSAEPDTAACVLASLAAGSMVSVPTGTTVMNGLNCGTVSSLAWPYLRGGMDAAIAVDDAAAAAAIASRLSSACVPRGR